jgi:hypothetical protein
MDDLDSTIVHIFERADVIVERRFAVALPNKLNERKRSDVAWAKRTNQAFVQSTIAIGRERNASPFFDYQFAGWSHARHHSLLHQRVRFAMRTHVHVLT